MYPLAAFFSGNFSFRPNIISFFHLFQISMRFHSLSGGGRRRQGEYRAFSHPKISYLIFRAFPLFPAVLFQSPIEPSAQMLSPAPVFRCVLLRRSRPRKPGLYGVAFFLFVDGFGAEFLKCMSSRSAQKLLDEVRVLRLLTPSSARLMVVLAKQQSRSVAPSD